MSRTEDLAQRYTELSQKAGNELNQNGETSRFEQIKADADQLFEFVSEQDKDKFVRQIHQR